MSEAEISAIKEELEHLKKVNRLMQEQQEKLMEGVLAGKAVEDVHFAALLALVRSHPAPQVSQTYFSKLPREQLPTGQPGTYSKKLEEHMNVFVEAFELASRASR